MKTWYRDHALLWAHFYSMKTPRHLCWILFFILESKECGEHVDGILAIVLAFNRSGSVDLVRDRAAQAVGYLMNCLAVSMMDRTPMP